MSTQIRTRSLAGFTLPASNILIALAMLYLIWGSTYLVIGYLVETMPPILITGSRFAVSGVLMFFILWWRGTVLPTRNQWRNAMIAGPLMGVAGAAVAFAQQSIGSGVAALAISAVPLWMVILASFIERGPNRLELMGLLLGIVGIIILNSNGEIWASPTGAIALMIGPISWAIGSTINRRLDKPAGLMNPATLLIFSGAMLIIASLVSGEHVSQMPSSSVVLGWLYLAIFGAIIAFSTYIYLLQNTSPALATSYAYVNPIIAVILGWIIAHEDMTTAKLLAAGLIVGAVMLISIGSMERSPST